MTDTLATRLDLGELPARQDVRFAQIDARFAQVDAPSIAWRSTSLSE